MTIVVIVTFACLTSDRDSPKENIGVWYLVEQKHLRNQRTSVNGDEAPGLDISCEWNSMMSSVEIAVMFLNEGRLITWNLGPTTNTWEQQTIPWWSLMATINLNLVKYVINLRGSLILAITSKGGSLSKLRLIVVLFDANEWLDNNNNNNNKFHCKFSEIIDTRTLYKTEPCGTNCWTTQGNEFNFRSPRSLKMRYIMWASLPCATMGLHTKMHQRMWTAIVNNIFIHPPLEKLKLIWSHLPSGYLRRHPFTRSTLASGSAALRRTNGGTEIRSCNSSNAVFTILYWLLLSRSARTDDSGSSTLIRGFEEQRSWTGSNDKER